MGKIGIRVGGGAQSLVEGVSFAGGGGGPKPSYAGEEFPGLAKGGFVI